MKNLLSLCLIVFCGCADFRYTPPSGPIFYSQGQEQPNHIPEYSHDHHRQNGYEERDINQYDYRSKAIMITGITGIGDSDEISQNAIDSVHSIFARAGYRFVESNAPLEIKVWVQSSISETPTLFSSKTNVRLKLFIRASNQFGTILSKEYKGHYKEEDADRNAVINKALEEAISSMMIDPEFLELLKK